MSAQANAQGAPVGCSDARPSCAVSPTTPPPPNIPVSSETGADQQGGAGRPVRIIVGVVARGLQLGRQLGFPTANIPLAEERPVGTGVYVVRSRLADGRAFFGVASVGCNPTIPKTAPVLEVWLFDFDEDIYDQTLSTELLAYLRPEEQFASVAALIDQVFADAEEARRYCKDHGLRLT